MTEAAATDSVVPNKDEITIAVLAHVLQLFGGWIAPLVIFLVKRQSRFVSFHALQVLLFRGLYLVVNMVFGGVCVAGVVFFAMQSQTTPHGALPRIFPALFLIFWGYFLVSWLVVLALVIIFGIKTGRGEWAEYPVLGGLARKILKIGTGGAPLPVTPGA